VLDHQALGVVAGEGQAPAQHLVEHHAQRVEVGLGRRCLAGDHLGRHVGGCPADGVCVGERRLVVVERLGEAEVDDLEQVAVGRLLGEDDVRRLEVAVDDALAVRGVERIADLGGDADGAGHGEGAGFA
jgi:hypothetical protein